MSAKGLRVLVIEDEALIRLELEDMLADLGCEIAGSAGNLDTALKLVDQIDCDIAVLDVNWPISEWTRSWIGWSSAEFLSYSRQDMASADSPVLIPARRCSRSLTLPRPWTRHLRDYGPVGSKTNNWPLWLLSPARNQITGRPRFCRRW